MLFLKRFNVFALIQMAEFDRFLDDWILPRDFQQQFK